MAEFKVGDVVLRKGSDVKGLIIRDDGTNIMQYRVRWDDHFYDCDGRGDPCAADELSLFRSADYSDKDEQEVNFILDYDVADEDSTISVNFSALKEVEARIKELAANTGLDRDRIKVYEIAKTYDVKLETRVIFGGTKVKLEEKAPKKRPAKGAGAKRSK